METFHLQYNRYLVKYLRMKFVLEMWLKLFQYILSWNRASIYVRFLYFSDQRNKRKQVNNQIPISQLSAFLFTQYLSMHWLATACLCTSGSSAQKHNLSMYFLIKCLIPRVMVRSQVIYLNLKHAEINSSRLSSQSKILVKVELTLSFKASRLAIFPVWKSTAEGSGGW